MQQSNNKKLLPIRIKLIHNVPTHYGCGDRLLLALQLIQCFHLESAGCNELNVLGSGNVPSAFMALRATKLSMGMKLTADCSSSLAHLNGSLMS
jgi:hypothetical protein